MTEGQTTSDSLGVGYSRSENLGESRGLSLGTADGASVSDGASCTESYQLVPMPRQKIVERVEGRFRRPIPEQRAEVMNNLARLPNRYAMVKCIGIDEPFIIKIHDVIDPWVLKGRGYLTAAWQADNVMRFLARVHAAHGYYFDPRKIRREIAEPVVKPRRRRELVAACDGPMGD